MKIELIEENPNKSALTFKVENMQLLGEFQTVLLSRNTQNLDNISPTAARLFKQLRELSTIQITEQGQDSLVTLSGTEKGWIDPAMSAFEAQDILEQEISLRAKFMDEANVTSSSGFTVIESFTPAKLANPFEQNPDKGQAIVFNNLANVTNGIFQKSIAPILERDGGSMEISSFHIDFNKKEILVDTISIASCYGCAAQGNTSTAAEKSLNTALATMQAKFKDAKDLQGLKYKVRSSDAPFGYALKK
ncbi:MAG: hypothetical protein MRY79_07965 [Alphaproteobacteria bacterium]|nr:hypothetical protein [Alphaproteobacteria bacterium]